MTDETNNDTAQIAEISEFHIRSIGDEINMTEEASHVMDKNGCINNVRPLTPREDGMNRVQLTVKRNTFLTQPLGSKAILLEAANN